MNAEILECLQGMCDDAGAKGKDNLARAFTMAKKSVQKCKENINSIEQTRGLKGVGPYIAARLEKHFRDLGVNAANPDPPETTPAVAPARKRARREYKPKFRSAAFGILVAMLEIEEKDGMPEVLSGKSEIVSLAQKYCDEPLVKPKRPGEYYDGWSAMNSTLMKKGLTFACSNPRKFGLTDEGRELAGKLKACANNVENSNMIINSFEAENHITTPRKQNRQSVSPRKEPQEGIDVGTVYRYVGSPSPRTERGNPGNPSFQIVLILDNREVYGSGENRDDFRRLVETAQDLPIRNYKLEIGDAVFAAECRGPNGTETYVLDYLIERKAGDDLPSSILDGRYERQKYFMLKSGVETLIYIAEGDFSKSKKIPPASLQKELTRLIAQTDFLVHQTNNRVETVNFFKIMSKWAQKKYSRWSVGDIKRERKSLEDWSEHMADLQKTRFEDIFCQMLLQIPGMGKAKIATLLNRPQIRTLPQLYERYQNVQNEDDGRKLLLNLLPGSRMGQLVSSNVYELFTAMDYGQKRFPLRKTAGTNSASSRATNSQRDSQRTDVELSRDSQQDSMGGTKGLENSTASIMFSKPALTPRLSDPTNAPEINPPHFQDSAESSPGFVQSHSHSANNDVDDCIPSGVQPGRAFSQGIGGEDPLLDTSASSHIVGLQSSGHPPSSCNIMLASNIAQGANRSPRQQGSCLQSSEAQAIDDDCIILD